MAENISKTLYKNSKKPFKVFIGSSCQPLGKSICKELEIDPGKISFGRHLNGEITLEILESVRGLDVFLIQSTTQNINDDIMELLIMIHSCKLASASRITAVIPFFPYSRHAKKRDAGDSITAKLLADMLTKAGADHILTMDLHSWQIQGYFEIPLDNLLAEPLMINWIKENIKNYQKAILISPHDGGVKRVAAMADSLQMDFCFVHKNKNAAKNTKNSFIVGNVANRDVIMVDDIADTCGTVLKATEKLKEAGALKIYVLCIHGVFSNGAIDKIRQSQIDTFVITNTIENSIKIQNLENMHVIDVGPTLAEAFRRDENSESVSYLYKNAYKSKT